jgi:ABC-type polysaccharide/polyol phosphate transport system ATPase subunit
MSAPAVVFDHVWKKFQRGERHDSLRDLVPALVRGVVGRKRSADGLERQQFWALQDISFEVRKGEALGIIGGNGAGKSTTLKLLTKILKPTRGRCAIQGRVGSLIEIAAGFHPDLTGRENVYLQGAIMGMKRHEIARKFDQIVEFAGVGDFIDTQVKRYSSGMNARLGFAVAAHLEPEVLLIDEVLSVGDFAFQEKAFRRMEAIVASGVPVVVVSHQLERIATLCTHAILLERGRLLQYGTPAECISTYVQSSAQRVEASENTPVRLIGLTQVSPARVRSGSRITLRIEGEALRAVPDHVDAAGIKVRALHTGQIVFATGTAPHGLRFLEPGPFAVEFDLQLNVPHGSYLAETSVHDHVAGEDIASGPYLLLEVEKGPSFWGTVQPNARLRRVPPELNDHVRLEEDAASPVDAAAGRRGTIDT